MLKFMKYKILLPLSILGLFVAILSFRYVAKARQSSEERRSIVIETAVKTIESIHFSPRPINDSFSARVYHMLLNQLDPDKLFFTEPEISVLKKYQFKIDDEIRMGSIEFFDSIDAIYLRGMG